MSNRNDNHDDKPWEKKFEDGKDENGLYSRRASKRKDKLNSRLPLVLLLVCSNDRTVFHIIKNCGTTHK